MALQHQLYRILLKKNDLSYIVIFDKEKGRVKRKTMRKSNFEDVDKTLYIWFTENPSQKRPISSTFLCEKAKALKSDKGSYLRKNILAVLQTVQLSGFFSFTGSASVLINSHNRCST